jgi:hypothetical protein
VRKLKLYVGLKVLPAPFTLIEPVELELPMTTVPAVIAVSWAVLMASVPEAAPATEIDWLLPLGSIVTVLLPSLIAETVKPLRLFAFKSILPVPVIEMLVLLDMFPVPEVVKPTVVPLMLPPRVMAPLEPDAVS